MSPLPIIAFDTSAINALEDDGIESEPIMSALKCGFDVRVLALNIDEVVANPNPVRREALVRRCLRLLASGKCLWPHHWVARLLMREYQRNPSLFDWQSVDIEGKGFEQALARRQYTDEVCIEQRDDQFSTGNNGSDFRKQSVPR